LSGRQSALALRDKSSETYQKEQGGEDLKKAYRYKKIHDIARKAYIKPKPFRN